MLSTSNFKIHFLYENFNKMKNKIAKENQYIKWTPNMSKRITSRNFGIVEDNLTCGLCMVGVIIYVRREL